VIVVGLGGMGSAAAHHLARRGRRVLGLDRFPPAHDRGSSHGGSRIIRLAYFEGPAYVPLLLSAYDRWRALERDSGCDLLTRTGGLLLGPPGSELVARSRATAEHCDLAHETLDAAAIRRRVPTLAPDDDAVGLFDPAGGLVRADATVSATLTLANAAGAELRFGEPVTGWEADPSGDGVVVRTAAGAFVAGHLVVCAGAWSPALLPDMTLPLTVERQLHTWFQPPGGLAPFLPDRHPVWVWDLAGAVDPDTFRDFVYGFPAVDGAEGGVKVNVMRDTVCTPDAIDRTVSDDERSGVAAVVRRCLTVDAGSIVRAEPCMFENTPDNHFVIGPHPAHPQVTVAAGFSGHGFKFVPLVGEILADLAGDGKTPHPIGLFDPGRFGPSAAI
jgi:sarcosine oxidase